jgi:hypothetical protein
LADQKEPGKSVLAAGPHEMSLQNRVGRIWNVPFQGRHAIALAEDDLSVLSHQYASHEHLGIDIRLLNSLETEARRLSTGALSQHCEGNRWE